jgi:uncharacterized protein (DUF1697 family)
MPAQIVLLRGINIGSRNRIAMPELREALAEAGFEDVKTYVQSGNIVLISKSKPEATARKVGRLIRDRFDLDIAVVARTAAELARVVKKNPLGDVAKDPKRYQVSFLAEKLKRETQRELEAAAVEQERVVFDGREIYAWHPAGVARSKLWAALASNKLAVDATARNWTTVTKLLEMAEGS